VADAKDRVSLYELGQQLETRYEIRRHEARVKSTGVRVVVHEIQVDREVLAIEDLFYQAGLYAVLKDPRVPRLIDAWQTEKSLYYVTLEQFGDPLFSKEARLFIESAGKNFIYTASFQSLSALAALHDCNILHRNVSAECFIVTPQGMPFMRHIGLNSRIRRIIDNLSGSADADLMLTANLYGCDVADWAATVASAVCRMPILDPAKRQNDSLIPEQVAVAAKCVIEHVKDKKFADFLVKCMEARADSTGGFENANVAAKAFPVEIAA